MKFTGTRTFTVRIQKPDKFSAKAARSAGYYRDFPFAVRYALILSRMVV